MCFPQPRPVTMAPDYPPISTYGAIGNLRTVALIAPDGSVDWWCPPRLDRPSVFGALLDRRRGGRFRVRPAEGPDSGRLRYEPETNVLTNRFAVRGGTGVLHDFMPLRGRIEGTDGSEAPCEIHRLLESEGSPVEWDVEWSPRFDYARVSPDITASDTGVVTRGKGDDMLVLDGLSDFQIDEDEDGLPLVRARISLNAGARHALVLRWGTEPSPAPLEVTDDWLDATCDTWRNWLHANDIERAWARDWEPHVIRSELALKLLCYSGTGAIAAAATTSLPEDIGGVRNWDYRYAWIRDSSRTAQALFALGHHEDGMAFLRWIEETALLHEPEDVHLRVLYGVHDDVDLTEHELTHLEGYQGSSPVRIGNAAARQRQTDVYGEVLDAAEMLLREGEPPSRELAKSLGRIGDRICSEWHKPDAGIWEVRQTPRHFVYTKAMCWLGLERALTLADADAIHGDVKAWRTTRDLIRKVTLRRGVDPRTGMLKQSFDRASPDAANLQLPLIGFLAPDDPRTTATLDATLEQLTNEDLVHRYRTDDGLSGGEGAFGITTMWLVAVLALTGRVDRAHEVFERFVRRAGEVGLFSEQIDPGTGMFLGNYPQAYTHIGILEALTYLARAEGREIPPLLSFGRHSAPEGIEPAPPVGG